MTVTVVKVGGSLSQKPQALRALCVKLGELAKKHALVVVPGGAEFADCVRDLDKRFSLSSVTAHRMAILGMDQYGLLLSDLMPNCQVADSLEEAKNASVGRLVVFLPSRFMFEDNALENSWEVTSDSIAAHIASRLDAEKVLLITDVDGIFTADPKKVQDAKLISQLTAQQLLAMNKRTSVDAYLPKLLLKLKLKFYIVNGLHPERVEAILDGHKAVCTVVA
jgi:aspartokinase-like uncharacterized kinase